MKIALIDYGAGNLFSVERALKFAGADYFIATKPEQIISAAKIVLPGVGAFKDGMRGLEKNKLDVAIKQAVAKQTPILGICLGMQLMMKTGHEFGTYPGLGIIDGKVDKIITNKKLPQIGWNSVTVRQANSPLFQGISSGSYFYFVHSFVTRPKDPKMIAATTDYGGDVFCSAIRYNHIYGTQFHPEKSGPTGLKIYQNFVRNVRPAARS